MDSKKLLKLKKSIYDMFELEEKKHQILLKLLECLVVKDYKEQNPEATSVVLASYHVKDMDTKIISKYPELECVASNNHKRIDRLQRRFQTQYSRLKLKSYDLTKFIPDKTIATCQEQITKSLN